MDVSEMCIDTPKDGESSVAVVESNMKRKLINSDEYAYQQQYQLQHRFLHQDCNEYDTDPINENIFKQLTDKCNFVYQQIGKYRQDPLRESERNQIIDQVYFAAEDMLKDLEKMRKHETMDPSILDEPISSNESTASEKYKMIRQARNLQKSSQPKYKRRSRNAMVGHRCHSCNTTDTPEWRRGPDGARTLCNACGLHYSKLLKKGSLTIQTHNYIESPPPPPPPPSQDKVITWP